MKKEKEEKEERKKEERRKKGGTNSPTISTDATLATPRTLAMLDPCSSVSCKEDTHDSKRYKRIKKERQKSQRLKNEWKNCVES
jgi:hypothetical protein